MSEGRTAAEQAIEAQLKQAFALIAAGQTGEAEELLREALRQLDLEGLRVHPLRAYALRTLCGLYLRLGRLAEAAETGAQEVAQWEEHLGPEHPGLAEPVEALALVHYQSRNWATAELLFQRAIDLFRRAGPPGEARSAAAQVALGKCYQRQGRYMEAAAVYRAMLPVFERQKPPQLELMDLLFHLGMAVARLGDAQQAEALLTRVLGMFDQVDLPRFPQESLVLNELLIVVDAFRQPAGAEQYARRAVALAEAHAPPEHPALSDALRHLARTLSAQGRQAEKTEVLLRALPVTETSYGPQSPMVGGILHNLAGGHFEAGRMDEAAALEERALAIYEAHAALAGPALADCLHSLGRIRQQQGRTAEARKLAARAQQLGYQKSEDGVISIGISEDQVGSSYRDSAK